MKFISLILLISIFKFQADSKVINKDKIDVATKQNKRPNFIKSQIQINKINIKVEIADTNEKHAYGLMYVQKLAEDEGMLFVFEKEEFRSFWMKNTLIPLSIGYFDKNRKLISIHDMKPENKPDYQLKTYPSYGLAKYALEMNTLWFSKNKVNIGDSFSF